MCNRKYDIPLTAYVHGFLCRRIYKLFVRSDIKSILDYPVTERDHNTIKEERVIKETINYPYNKTATFNC